MAFLLATNVVSELRKSSPNPRVLGWQAAHSRAVVYLSTMVVGEIRRGIERVRPRDPKQADVLERWLSGLTTSYGDRLLPVTAQIAEEWGRMSATPEPPPIIDGLMAATARVHGLALVTRNVADVSRTGVTVVNPFD
ncbi:type II toxin-antitoxin system VapC family toxin [Paractinoplanes lichenicola]|uniref:Type II toxin-antitoxin system VapC family toxin n=1 Tax=Paractinoplanes lichenicola TaxID=2802976 RepID=A0ABS1VPZ9_9ACTN|nr:type II toxin-antitoxin system VapC family toxin [Actinoplanes lichenicola]MBL7256678.1 type II toxin-antitoxin system VapC family toxin [Actinoplanes lichenicola]